MGDSYVQIYMGNGKGKTTAAVGLAVRAAGRGLRVKFVQFIKGRDTGEMFILEQIDKIEFVRVSQCKKFFHMLSNEEKAALRQEVCDVLPTIHKWLDQADVIILDEALGAVENGFMNEQEVLSIIDRRGSSEIVMTGRIVPDAIAACAHLITQMKDVKHYMDIGVSARCGIEY